jgi:hypothetical protein
MPGRRSRSEWTFAFDVPNRLKALELAGPGAALLLTMWPEPRGKAASSPASKAAASPLSRLRTAVP